MRIAREEIFGPVISALPFDDLEEVARRANSTVYGLGAYIWTRDVGRVHRMVKLVKSGNVWVNSSVMLDPAVPFGGVKQSGYGRELGLEQLEEFLDTKSVWIRTP